MAETTPDEIVNEPDGIASQEVSGMPADLSMVVLSARDLAGLRRFYRALGWTEQPGASDALSIFDLGGVALALHPDSEPAAKDATDPEAGATPAVTLVVRVAGAGEVDAACSSAVRAGARIVSEPQDQPWGGRSALVADPEGNRWELLWVPGASSSTANEPQPRG
jgi:predicted enzyme related to lactoylglutathione lyase